MTNGTINAQPYIDGLNMKYQIDTTFVIGKIPKINPIYHTAEDQTLKNLVDFILGVHVFDSSKTVKYTDSNSIYITKFQLYDSVLGRVKYSDSNIIYVTKFQLTDSVVGKVKYSDSTVKYVTPYQISNSIGPNGSVLFSNGISISNNNSHFYYDNTNFRLGLNTTSPLASLDVAEISTNTIRGIINSQFNNGTNSAQFNGVKYRGSVSAPSSIQSGDFLTRFIGWGYEGTSVLAMGDIKIVSTGTISTGRIPTYMTFSTATDASPSVLTERMRIWNDGNICIGTTATAGFLTLAGSISWPTGLGVINHLYGPTDQNFTISSASSRNIDFKVNGVNNISIAPNGGLFWNTGLGAITHISGSSDQTFLFNSPQGNYNFTSIGVSKLQITSASVTINTLLNWASSLGAGTVHMRGPNDADFRIQSRSPNQTSAAQAGRNFLIEAANASPGTASGAAAGGSMTISSGSAGRNATGNANAGDWNAITGSGIGTGTAGVFNVKIANTTKFSVDATGKSNFSGDLVYGSGIGTDYTISGGAAIAGTATLVAGTKTVSTTSVKAGDIIVVSGNTAGTSTSTYFAPVASIVAATSFVINAYTPGGVVVNITDVSSVNWIIIHTH